MYLFGTGTAYNRIIGNYIGVNVYGTSSLPNGTGVLLRYGAGHNFIGGAAYGEGNIISGNRGDIFPFNGGVIIYDIGTEYNLVAGNLIGTSLDTTRALRNGSSGVILGNGARYNTVGGTTAAEANIISGNGSGSYTPGLGRGVHVFGEGTRYNKIIGNYIGSSPAGATNTINIGHGLVVCDGARNNEIGGNSPESGNVFSYNDGHGVLLTGSDTRYNPVRYNSFFDNDSLGIALQDTAQSDIVPPRLTNVSIGRVTGDGAPPFGVVDIYLADSDISGSGEGRTFIGSDTADGDGLFDIAVTPLTSLDTVTAQVTDPEGNSSEFSLNLTMGVFTDIQKETDVNLP